MDMRKKSILRRLIPWIIALAALAALIFFVFVPMYSQTEKTFGRDSEVFFYDGDGKALTMENDRVVFFADGETEGREIAPDPLADTEQAGCLSNVLDAMESGAPLETPVGDNAGSFRIVCAAERSVASGAWEVPL